MPIVSAIQTSPVLGDVTRNLKNAIMLAFEAANKGARIIVLPELCTSGYGMRSKREAAALSQTKNGYQTQKFISLAKSTSSYIIFGYVEAQNSKLYNSAACVTPDGKIYNYQKHNLWGNDYLWASPSEALFESITTPYGKLGTLICRDASNNYRQSYKLYNSDYRFYTKGSVDILALLTNWGDAFGYPDSAWVDLSESLNANVIVSNRVGSDQNINFKGGSCVIDRTQNIYTYGSSFTDECVVGGVI